MAHASLTFVRREHRALSAMLRSIVLLLGRHRRGHTLPDFAALRAMLFYVDEFAERLHQSKESRLHFPKLRGHAARLENILDRLEREHALKILHALPAVSGLGGALEALAGAGPPMSPGPHGCRRARYLAQTRALAHSGVAGPSSPPMKV